jgi:predicted Na+-dependent transporter
MAGVPEWLQLVSAGAPFAVPGTTIAKGGVPYAIGLMVVSAALSVVLTPLLLALLLARLPGASSLTIDCVGIAKTSLALVAGDYTASGCKR